MFKGGYINSSFDVMDEELQASLIAQLVKNPPAVQELCHVRLCATP